jgi:aminoglycoside 6'-N-acetyltransferase
VRVSLPAMTADDLPLVVTRLARPHVTRWWYESPTLEQAQAKYLPRFSGAEPTHMLTVLEAGAPIGLVQWYRWDDYASERDRYRIGAGELGIDYTIGEPVACHRGLGTELVGRLLKLLHGLFPPGTPVSVTPEAANRPSCRILEKNGFALVEVLRAEPGEGIHPEGPTARYRRLLVNAGSARRTLPTGRPGRA